MQDEQRLKRRILLLNKLKENSNGRYRSVLGACKAKYEARNIHIKSRNIAVVYEQIKEIAEIFPPVKKDVNVLDLTEMIGSDKCE